MNANEQAFVERLESDGWTVLRNGWPDFLCVKGKHVKAIELKYNTDTVRPNQTENHQALRLAGLTVEVKRITNGACEGEQQVRLRTVPVDTVRQAKSNAALLGKSLEDYLTELLMKSLHKKKRSVNGRQNKT